MRASSRNIRCRSGSITSSRRMIFSTSSLVKPCGPRDIARWAIPMPPLPSSMTSWYLLPPFPLREDGVWLLSSMPADGSRSPPPVIGGSHAFCEAENGIAARVRHGGTATQPRLLRRHRFDDVVVSDRDAFVGRRPGGSFAADLLERRAQIDRHRDPPAAVRASAALPVAGVGGIRGRLVEEAALGPGQGVGEQAAHLLDQ